MLNFLLSGSIHQRLRYLEVETIASSPPCTQKIQTSFTRQSSGLQIKLMKSHFLLRIIAKGWRYVTNCNFCLGVPMLRSNIWACLPSSEGLSGATCSVGEPCIILKIIITLFPSLPLCLLNNSTSVTLSSHIVFSKH